MNNATDWSTASISDRGLSDKRPVNEDSMLSLEQFGVFAVADGVGGAQAGDVASQMAMEIIGEAFLHYGDTVDPEEILRVSMERANEAIHQMATELPQLSSMATTVAAIQVSGDIVTIAHVGDSRVYRLDPDGRLHRETDDHSMVEEEVRAGRMTPEQALNHPGRNIISRAVGAEPTVDVEIKTIMTDPGSTFLVCTDGVTRHISDDELEHLLTTGMSPEMVCQQIKDICYERGAEDNLTAILVRAETQQTAAEEPVRAAADEMETETVATARPAFEEQARDEIVFESDDAFDASESETETFEAHDSDLAEEREIEMVELNEEIPANEPVAETAQTGGSSPAEPEYVPPSVVVPAGRQQAADRDLQMFGNTVAAKTAPPIASGSLIGTILSSLIWLVLGSLLGITGYYLWHQNNPIEHEPPPQLVEKTQDIQLSAFAESRRIVDSDPEAYLKAKAASPQDAIDHYLLGRAMLLMGRLWDADKQFDLAKAKLGEMAEADQKDVPTLKADIAIGQALAKNSAVGEAMKKELDAMREAVKKDSEPAANSIAANSNAASQ